MPRSRLISSTSTRESRTSALVTAFANDYSNYLQQCSFASGCNNDDIDAQANGGRPIVAGFDVRLGTEPRVGTVRFPLRASYTFTYSELREDIAPTGPDFSGTGLIQLTFQNRGGDMRDLTAAGSIHVLGGIAEGTDAHATFLETLRYALAHSDQTILIEPVCQEQLPGFFLRTMDQAAAIIAEVDHARLKIMFDCYHVHTESGDGPGLFAAHADRIGHVQIAAAEGRAEPYPGALDYSDLLPHFHAQGYDGPIGAEYRPAGATEDGLGWMQPFRTAMEPAS